MSQAVAVPTRPTTATGRANADRQLCVVDLEHVLRTWVDQQAAQGKITGEQAHALWREHGHDLLGGFKSYFPIAKDVSETSVLVKKIIGEFGIRGRYVIKTYRGRNT